MLLKSNLGEFVCITEVELDSVIRKCAEKSLDDIWIYSDAEYPCLAILVNGEQTSLTYFAAEEEFYGSVGDMELDGIVEFNAGGQISEVAAYTVVSLDLAIECAIEFMNKKERPVCMEWDEL